MSDTHTALDLHESKFSGVFCAMAVAALLALSGLSWGMIGTADAAQPADGVPNFSGFWIRPEGGNGRMFYPPDEGPGPLVNMDETRAFTIGDHTNPILQPGAAAAVQAFGDKGRAGEVIYPAWSLCWPPGVPLVLNMAEPLQLLQTDDQVFIVYQRGNQFRQIDLNAEHPENLRPSWLGHSIGHFEGGDTLVVDTIAQDTRSLTDRFGTPKSDAMRVVERYTISPDRQTLSVAFEVEDPKTFTTRWSAKMAYIHPSSRPGYDPDGFNRDGEEIAESICQENNRDAAGGLFDIPIAERADF
nr:MAG: hypothetical protein E4H34_00365 [Hyphomicrobiales bacterium]